MSDTEDEDEFEENDGVTNNDNDEDDINMPDFWQGLHEKHVQRVKDARKLYFERQQQVVNLQNNNNTTQLNNENEWKGILSLPELNNATFDFNVLKNLNNAQQQGNNFTYNEKSSTSNISRQRFDPWRYDLHRDAIQEEQVASESPQQPEEQQEQEEQKDE